MSVVMKAIGYIRVSTKDQGRHGTSLAYQEERVKVVCEEKNWELISIFSDDETGTTLDRLGFISVMELINEWDILVITKPDRLSRNLGDAENLFKNYFEPMAKNVWSTEKSMNLTTNPDVRVFTSAMSSVEVRHINERTIQGMHTASELGYWVGKAPMGYKTESVGKSSKDRKKLVPNQETIDVARLIFTLGSDDLTPLGRIAKQTGVSHRSVKRILSNPVYYGYRILHDDIREMDSDGNITRNERINIWVKHNYELIINEHILKRCWIKYNIGEIVKESD